MKYNSNTIAKLLLDIGVVSINLTTPYRYASGMLSPIYCDNRLIISYPEVREKIIMALLELINEQALCFDVIAGTATAGIPHASLLAHLLKKPMVYVRSAEKKHGKTKQVEGLILKGQSALIVEDHISTGSSAINACQALRQAGAIVHDCIGITTYDLPTAHDHFAAIKLHLHTLTNFSTLINVFAKRGKITAQEKNLALRWNQDPDRWTKDN